MRQDLSRERMPFRAELLGRTTEELVSILRNHDEAEWRAEAFEAAASILAERGVSPESVMSLGPEGIDVMEGQALVAVGRYFDTASAHIHRMALEASGLQAWVGEEVLGSMYGVGVGARLLVRAQDEELALAALASRPLPSSSLPDELAEAPCPKCGSREVSPKAVVSPGELAGRRVWTMQCASCGHSWPDEAS